MVTLIMPNGIKEMPGGYNLNHAEWHKGMPGGYNLNHAEWHKGNARKHNLVLLKLSIMEVHTMDILKTHQGKQCVIMSVIIFSVPEVQRRSAGALC